MKIDAAQVGRRIVEEVKLRAATPDDAAALALVGGATFLEAFTWMLPGADIVAHCARHHTAEAYAGYLARATTRITLAVAGEDAPVGFVMVTAPDLPSFDVQPGDVELKRIYMLSRFRAGTVVGAAGVRPADAMMLAAIASARELGGSRLLLGVHKGNVPAIRFYERHGFAVVGTRTFEVGRLVCSDLLFGLGLAQ